MSVTSTDGKNVCTLLSSYTWGFVAGAETKAAYWNNTSTSTNQATVCATKAYTNSWNADWTALAASTLTYGAAASGTVTATAEDYFWDVVSQSSTGYSNVSKLTVQQQAATPLALQSIETALGCTQMCLTNAVATVTAGSSDPSSWAWSNTTYPNFWGWVQNNKWVVPDRTFNTTSFTCDQLTTTPAAASSVNTNPTFDCFTQLGSKIAKATGSAEAAMIWIGVIFMIIGVSCFC